MKNLRFRFSGRLLTVLHGKLMGKSKNGYSHLFRLKSHQRNGEVGSKEYQWYWVSREVKQKSCWFRKPIDKEAMHLSETLVQKDDRKVVLS